MKEGKTSRLLKMMMLLSGKKRYTMEELCDRFQSSERTTFRDLGLIEAAGFALERERGYRLAHDSNVAKSLQTLLHFSDEEAAILYQTLDQIEGASAVKERLVRKLHTFYDLEVLKRLQRSDDLSKVKIIGESIKKKRQLVIRNYRSGHSGQIADRRVEAFDFMADYRAIWCYDHGSEMVKQFKVSRMESVEMHPYYWEAEQLHCRPFTDAFRISAAEARDEVRLRLSLKAYNLLLEEFPLTGKYLAPDGKGAYVLKAPVADYSGIGRFVLGLPEDVAVEGSAQFAEYLRAKVRAFL